MSIHVTRAHGSCQPWGSTRQFQAPSWLMAINVFTEQPLRTDHGQDFRSRSNVAEALSKTCSSTGLTAACSRPQGGTHVPCSGRIATQAAIYHRELCRAVLRGVSAQLKEDGLLKDGYFGVRLTDDEEAILANCEGPDVGATVTILRARPSRTKWSRGHASSS